MTNIEPFSPLENGESELTKKEVAVFLDMYFNFIIEMVNNEDKSFMDIFTNSRDKIDGINNNDAFVKAVRESSYYTEYDYMIQISNLYTIIKFFSYYIDSNLYKIGDIGEENIDDRYFISNSTRYNKLKTINFIRNALNHNDKKDFELYRLIKKQNDSKIYIEIYLRRPNFHIKVTVDELLDILKPVLRSKSVYNYLYYDNAGNIIKNPEELVRKLDEEIYYEINQAFDFTDSDVVDNVLFDYNRSTFKIRIPFTKEQKEGIKNCCNALK